MKTILISHASVGSTINSLFNVVYVSGNPPTIMRMITQTNLILFLSSVICSPQNIVKALTPMKPSGAFADKGEVRVNLP